MCGSESAQCIVLVTTTSTLLVEASARRIGLVIGGPTANPVTLSFTAAAVAGEGVRLPAGGDPLVLSAALHGDIVRRSIAAITAAGAETLGVWEVYE